jgi:UDP-N-acetylmuramoylalanine--D-glutamate ligase
MQAYTAAKRRILDFQSSEDAAVLGRDDAGAYNLASHVHGKLFTFGLHDSQHESCTYLSGDTVVYRDGGMETWLLNRSSIQLRGEHNLLNVLAACAISIAAGLPVEAMPAGVEGFLGVSHRLELVRRWGDADWYNDSIATAPERSMAAIRSFDEPLVLLAGGRDKDLPWDDFARLVRQRVDHLILFGEAAEKIARAMGLNYPLVRCTNLREAVQAAAGVVKPGDVVLLSPGGTSYDAYTDFAERGEHFRRLVMAL